jgi:hypothetical protein
VSLDYFKGIIYASRFWPYQARMIRLLSAGPSVAGELRHPLPASAAGCTPKATDCIAREGVERILYMAKVMEGRKVVMVEVPAELVARADAAAGRELLNRSSWLRRLVDSATKGLPA